MDFHNWGVGWGRRWLGEGKKEVLFSCTVSRICKPTLLRQEGYYPTSCQEVPYVESIICCQIVPLYQEVQ